MCNYFDSISSMPELSWMSETKAVKVTILSGSEKVMESVLCKLPPMLRRADYSAIMLLDSRKREPT